MVSFPSLLLRILLISFITIETATLYYQDLIGTFKSFRIYNKLFSLGYWTVVVNPLIAQ